MKNARYFGQILVKLEFSQHTIEKYSNINFNENLSVVSQVVPYGRNKHHAATSLFRDFSKVPKNGIFCRFLASYTFKSHCLTKICASNNTEYVRKPLHKSRLR